MSKRDPARRLALGLCGLLLACRRGMESQPKLLPLQESAFFADGRASRPRVPGAVARGSLSDDDALETRTADGRETDLFPFAIGAPELARGRERYDVYCAPCHGRTGTGDGMVVRRGFPRPPSFHEARLRAAPTGRLVEAIAKGSGAMYPFADRVAARDRWEIAAYIRALQLSREASLDDATPQERAALEKNP
jgi:mono/diheme cytochrome c family protein